MKVVDLYRKVWREMHLATELRRVRQAQRKLYRKRRQVGLTCRGTPQIYKIGVGVARRKAQRRALRGAGRAFGPETPVPASPVQG